jgi:hypothetical protein
MVETAIGEIRLMSPPDYECMVINGRSGYIRNNSSWIIGRIMRDFESWMDDRKHDGPIRTHLREMINQRWEMIKRAAEEKSPGSGRYVPRPLQAGLCVSVYKADHARPGYPGYDLVYLFGFGTVAVQLGVAAIPWGVFGDWSIFLITASGILLAFVTGSMSQWPAEKWACRRNSSKTVILTRGNGSQHAIVVIGDGKGLDLEDLAVGPAHADVPVSHGTRFAVTSLTALWVFLLITAAGIKQNTWFLLAIGTIGILNNTFVAGSRRFPKAFGVPLVYQCVIGKPKVWDTLLEVEKAYPRVGMSMLSTFFPSRLPPELEKVWKDLENSAPAREASHNISNIGK